MAQGESVLSRRIAERLRARGVFVFKIHGGPTMMTGLPDLAGCYRGLSLWWETKMPDGGEPTPAQRYRHEQIRRAGGLVCVPRSVDDALALLDQADRLLDSGAISAG